MIDPQEERAKFISLREALFLIAQAKGKTPQEAAAMLLHSMDKNSDWQALSIRRYCPARGLIYWSKTNRAVQLIERLALENKHSKVVPNDDDIPF